MLGLRVERVEWEAKAGAVALRFRVEAAPVGGSRLQLQITCTPSKYCIPKNLPLSRPASLPSRRTLSRDLLPTNWYEIYQRTRLTPPHATLCWGRSARLPQIAEGASMNRVDEGLLGPSEGIQRIQ